MVVIIWFSGNIKCRRKSVCALKMKYRFGILKNFFHDKCVTAQRLLWKELFFMFSESIFGTVQYDHRVGSSIELQLSWAFQGKAHPYMNFAAQTMLRFRVFCIGLLSWVETHINFLAHLSQSLWPASQWISFSWVLPRSLVGWPERDENVTQHKECSHILL